MKKRITVDQLNELSEKQKQKLRSQWVPSKGDIFISDNEELVINYIGDWLLSDVIVSVDYTYGERLFDLEDCLPLIDIGQMIEILEDEFINIHDVINNQERTETICDTFWNEIKKIL